MALQGEIRVPSDKSITHRAIMLSSIAKGQSRIVNPLRSMDTDTTLSIMQSLGVTTTWDGDDLFIEGSTLEPHSSILDCGNAGTTVRLLMGLLSGRTFSTILTGDASLKKRPMRRVADPLRKLGANIILSHEDYLPGKVLPSKLHGGKLELSIASAQVKSAVLLAALNQKEKVTVKEFGTSRDHTERMIYYLDGQIKKDGPFITISGEKPLVGKEIVVPGDLSSAAFFIIAALIVPDSDITIRDVGLNPTRTGMLDVLKQTGAELFISNVRELNGEPIGDISVKYTKTLKPFIIHEALVPRVIDEIPILSLLGTQIEGISKIYGACELRVKETDRLKATAIELNKLGADVKELADGLEINGKSRLKEASVSSYGDHRMSMMLQIAELLTGPLEIQNRSADKISYPQFSSDLKQLLR